MTNLYLSNEEMRIIYSKLEIKEEKILFKLYANLGKVLDGLNND